MQVNVKLNFELRQSVIEDCELLFRLQKLDGASFDSSNEEQVLAFKEYKTAFNPALIQVVVIGGVAIGRLRVVRGDDFYIGGMQLLPEWRGQGISTAILKQLIQEADELNKVIRLEVFHNNPQAQRLYKRVGF